ncbi:YceI family protein [Mucilaginibacter limnophilus]|uniref:YceI family protein n=1 Tax=Mucilaginibacter limnophilus TaxID=1932778 RepID=A0A437MYD5_9SPHI|nr:YceI family protein [Mucilaginibacter limnophilus]RVU02700.1 YceI family protein [Mucilaginibacter limnophilus]
MKHLLVIIALVAGLIKDDAPAGLYACKNVRITLYSSAPLEDIEAESNAGKSVFNPATGELAFNVAIRSFKFPKSLMQEHFNENYMESDKYPQASFRGKINEKIDVNANGSFPVTVSGVLDVHGVKQNRTVKGTVNVNNGSVSMSSEFMVRCADHNIEIPKLVFKKIAETIKMTVSATYSPLNNQAK